MASIYSRYGLGDGIVVWNEAVAASWSPKLESQGPVEATTYSGLPDVLVYPGGDEW